MLLLLKGAELSLRSRKGVWARRLRASSSRRLRAGQMPQRVPPATDEQRQDSDDDGDDEFYCSR